MKTKIIYAIAAVLLLATSAHATPGNGGGEGNNTGCNGQGNANSPCGGTTTPPQNPPPVLVPGPKGEKGDKGDSVKGDKGDPGDSVAGEPGAEGKPGASIVGPTGATGAAGKDATLPADIVTQGQLNSATQQLGERIEANDKRASAGIASVLGVASIPQTVDPDSVSIGAGAGYYRGETGVALGASWRNKAGDWIGKAAVTVDSRGSAGVGVGAAFSWK
jgi:autotransporter adhesin